MIMMMSDSTDSLVHCSVCLNRLDTHMILFELLLNNAFNFVFHSATGGKSTISIVHLGRRLGFLVAAS